ncbi:MAG: hypothetical protein F7C36_01355 [Desulfurococcales archaeon]|nr:hypothetical protein [Desulfurococcales archaeon]
MNSCPKKSVRAYLKGSVDTPIRLEAFYHPATCRGIRYPHIDIVLPEDQCGIKSYFLRGGGAVPYHYHNGLFVVNLGDVMGYPCILEIDLSGLGLKIEKHKGIIYIRLSRSGNLYVRLPV